MRDLNGDGLPDRLVALNFTDFNTSPPTGQAQLHVDYNTGARFEQVQRGNLPEIERFLRVLRAVA